MKKKDNIQRSDIRMMMLLAVIAVGSICVMIFRDAVRGEQKEMRDGEGADGNASETVVEGRTYGVEGGVDVPGGKVKELGMFDPNTIDSISLLKYGLGSVQIHSLMSYRRHKGTFDRPLAVSRLYNWSDEDVEKVLPYMVISDKYKKTYHYREQYEAERKMEYEREGKRYEKQESRDVSQKAKDEKDGYERKYDVSNKFSALTRVDINTADTTLLRRVPGVGSAIANSIVNLREKLGGFYSVEQLGKIGYLSPELYKWFEVRAEVKLRTIDINRASFQVLNAHPYISYNQARDLMEYRRLYGNIKDREGLVGSGIFKKEEVERLEPYLEY